MSSPRFLSMSLWCVGLFFTATILAMVTYYGGNPMQAAAPYSLTQNFLSDLGVIDTYSHINQTLTNFFWLVALACASLGTMLFVAGINRTKVARWSGALAGCSILSIGLIPSDLFFWPHRIALLTTVILLTVTLGILSKQSAVLPRIGFAICAAYALFLILAPHPDTSDTARLQHIIVQKVFVVGAFGMMATESARRLRA
jgi:hypothetical protein